MKPVEEIIAAVLGIPAEEITDASSPSSVPSWDSLKQLNIVIALEDEYGVEFEDEELGQLLSVKLIKHILKEKTGQA